MRENIIQSGGRLANGSIHIPNDWYGGEIPANVFIHPDVYIETSYSFAHFNAETQPGLLLGKAVGCYDRASFVTGKFARIEVGDFTILNGCTIICNQQVAIGQHCMLAWGSVVTDTWLSVKNDDPIARRNALKNAAASQERIFPAGLERSKVVIEDNVWIGFDAVVLPGAHIGRGSVIGGKSVVSGDIPPYSVVVGNPGKIIRSLPPTDIPIT